MEIITNVSNPIIGEYYQVKCVIVNTIWRPVFDKSHCDNKKHALNKEHYHQDWRFVPEELVLAQRRVFSSKMYDPLPHENREYFAPIMKSQAYGEEYRPMEYLRHFNHFSGKFGTLEQDMKKAKMKNMICPHHKTNLKSCIPINGVLQCPQHGLKWNIKTGDLIPTL